MSEQTREKIFQGVLSLAQQGVPMYEVKVQAIATAAGLGKGTLYEYFSSKEEILAAGSSYRVIAAALTAPQAEQELPVQARQPMEQCKERLTALIQQAIDTGRREGRISPSSSDEYCRYVLKAALLSVCAAQSCEGEAGLNRSGAHVRAMICKALA